MDTVIYPQPDINPEQFDSRPILKRRPNHVHHNTKLFLSKTPSDEYIPSQSTSFPQDHKQQPHFFLLDFQLQKKNECPSSLVSPQFQDIPSQSSFRSSYQQNVIYSSPLAKEEDHLSQLFSTSFNYHQLSTPTQQYFVNSVAENTANIPVFCRLDRKDNIIDHTDFVSLSSTLSISTLPLSSFPNSVASKPTFFSDEDDNAVPILGSLQHPSQLNSQDNTTFSQFLDHLIEESDEDENQQCKTQETKNSSHQVDFPTSPIATGAKIEKNCAICEAFSLIESSTRPL